MGKEKPSHTLFDCTIFPRFCKFHIIMITYDTELNVSKIMICLRKSEVSVERILVCNVLKSSPSVAFTVCHALIPMTL